MTVTPLGFGESPAVVVAELGLLPRGSVIQLEEVTSWLLVTSTLPV